jgi:3-mercaptopyruvate sulfurtransferase SseA
MKKQFRDFESAREFVGSLGLKNNTEWRLYCNSGDMPDDIPSHPDGTYKNKWKGYGDWLGTGTVATKDKIYRPFKEARKFARELELKSSTEWNAYCKSGNKPHDIPRNADRTYKNDFKSWGDWLGTGIISRKDKIYRPFKETREFVRSLGLKNRDEWDDYCKSGNKPDDIPTNPWRTYRESKKK